MRHAKVESWAGRSSAIHRLHPAAKLIAILVILVAISTLQHHEIRACSSYFILLLAITLAAGLPVIELMLTALTVVPFAASFAVIGLFAGETERALLLVMRAYASSYGALVLIATTPMPALISGMGLLRVPRFLLLVMQFLYRYLVVLFEEASEIRDVSASRGGSIRTLQLKQAGAAVGVLFAKAYQRANSIYQAMLARGFEGSIPILTRSLFSLRDGLFIALIGMISYAIRVIA